MWLILYHSQLILCSVIMKLILFLSFLPVGYFIKLFSFESTVDTNQSYATIKFPTNLPKVFTLCSSFKETFIDGTSFFTIYGENNEPWLTLSNWVTQNKITLWLRINTRYVKVGVIQNYWMNFWINMCIYAIQN